MSEWAVPGYTVVRELGKGGFGAVVLARHDATGTLVAIKYLLPGEGQNPDSGAMFRDEAQTLSALDDPYVVRLYEYVESAAGAAIVMELVEGVTLEKVIKQYGTTSPESALVMMYGSLLGLAAAHARGVVHRDYKPANVLINANGASKLTDFGIAARAGAEAVRAVSAPYSPPEQFAGGPASPAGDVYAATATFYECLTGQPPFTGTTMDVIWQHQSASVPMDPVPEPLRPLVARGMAKDPKYRPADAAAFAAELRTIAIGAYGPDWEGLGRSQLASAAILLAALWPTAGLPALHAASAQQVNLTHAAAQHAQAAKHTPSKAGLHRLHLRHLLHLEHLARTATIAVTATAVVAAAATVAYTARAPGGPGGTPAHPAVAAYQAPLAPAIPATLTSINKPVNGDTYVEYGPDTADSAFAKLSGTANDATAGEVARLYAQQFPFTSAPVLAQTVTLNPVGGTAAYSFTVSPSLATRYQIKLFRNTAATTPTATSAINTVYVVDGYKVTGPSCNPLGACVNERDVTIYAPPSAIQTEMSKQPYMYLRTNEHIAVPPYEMGLESSTASKPKLITANSYSIVLTDTAGYYVTRAFCIKQTEALDGMGLPGPSSCGAKSIPESAYYVFGL